MGAAQQADKREISIVFRPKLGLICRVFLNAGKPSLVKECHWLTIVFCVVFLKIFYDMSHSTSQAPRKKG